jgi:DNA-directed RNA polymerase specialized sigma54-like protein
VSLSDSQTVSSENSPQLENIKVETNQLPDATYQAFKDLVVVAESNHSKLQEFLSKARNNEPIPPGIFKEQEESLKIGGIIIFNEHRKVISKVRCLLYSTRSVSYEYHNSKFVFSKNHWTLWIQESVRRFRTPKIFNVCRNN